MSFLIWILSHLFPSANAQHYRVCGVQPIQPPGLQQLQTGREPKQQQSGNGMNINRELKICHLNLSFTLQQSAGLVRGRHYRASIVLELFTRLTFALFRVNEIRRIFAFPLFKEQMLQDGQHEKPTSFHYWDWIWNVCHSQLPLLPPSQCRLPKSPSVCNQIPPAFQSLHFWQPC